MTHQNTQSSTQLCEIGLIGCQNSIDVRDRDAVTMQRQGRTADQDERNSLGR